jgi:hypothetical protein
MALAWHQLTAGEMYPIFVFSLPNRHISALCLKRLSNGRLSMSNGAFAFFAMTLSTISVALLAVLVFSF